MLNFKSKLSVEELKARWDEFTSPSRFAGSDETLDLVFVSKRNDEKVKLVRHAKSTREPFSCVFRGKIKQTEQGSEIAGVFTKAWIDYLFVVATIGLIFYIRAGIIERGDSLNTINAVLAFSLIAGILLLFNTRGTKRRYCDFISRITGEENSYFLKKDEQTNEEGKD